MRWPRHYFLPHPDNGHRAHLLKTPSLFLYLALFVALQVGLMITSLLRPDILGIKSTVTTDQIIELTNKEREKAGAPPLKVNDSLTSAAFAKGKDMIDKNYWSHATPDGRQPWDFILENGYIYVFAGENLARNFSDSQSVVKAWMTSPTHKANLLDSHYREIGVAILEGFYGGQETVLIVQMFGTPPPQPIASSQPTATKIETPRPTSAQATATAVARPSSMPLPTVMPAERMQTAGLTAKSSIKSTGPMISSVTVSRAAALVLVLFVCGLLVIDWLVVSGQKVVRQVGHHSPHLFLLILIALTLLTIHAGEITLEAAKHVAIFW